METIQGCLLFFIFIYKLKANFFAQKNQPFLIDFYIIYSVRIDSLLAGLARFELPHARVKDWCLTAWLQTNIKLYKWGGRWDSNPRSPVPQTGALTNYATSTMAYVLVFLALLYFNSFHPSLSTPFSYFIFNIWLIFVFFV